MTTTSAEKKGHRVALYARVSTTGHGQDVGLQLDDLRQVAAQRGWQVVEYVDNGISGTKENRPALDRLMVDARAGHLDVIAVWRFDRFARSTTHLLQALEEFRVLGVGFISTREQVDTTTPVGKVLFTLIAAISEFERTLIVERVRAGVARAQENGTHCGRPFVDIDLRPAISMLEADYGLKAISKSIGVSRATLRRRLEDAGEWPRPS